MEMTTALIVLAAGQGTRASGQVSKQFATDARGRTVLEAGLARAARSVAWRQVVVVAPADALDRVHEITAAAGLADAEVVAGADDRLESMRRGLARVDSRQSPVTVVHDGVRPFTPPDLFTSVVDLVRDGSVDAAWPAACAANTIVDTQDVRALPAGRLLVVSTPICVTTRLARELLASGDSASVPLIGLLLAAGVRWATVSDSPMNFKVTSSRDLRDALQLLDQEPHGLT